MENIVKFTDNTQTDSFYTFEHSGTSYKIYAENLCLAKRVLRINLNDLQRKYKKRKEEEIEKERELIDRTIRHRLEQAQVRNRVNKDKVVILSMNDINLNEQDGYLYLSYYDKDMLDKINNIERKLKGDYND